jgi:hypothetical protein
MPCERSKDRRVFAHGHKSKTDSKMVGKVTFVIPQARKGNFYLQALEKGFRSEQSLLLALAELYVQGVSTRDVAAYRAFNTRLRLQRTETIMEGNDKCDFRIYAVDEKPEKK